MATASSTSVSKRAARSVWHSERRRRHANTRRASPKRISVQLTSEMRWMTPVGSLKIAGGGGAETERSGMGNAKCESEVSWSDFDTSEDNFSTLRKFPFPLRPPELSNSMSLASSTAKAPSAFAPPRNVSADGVDHVVQLPEF